MASAQGTPKQPAVDVMLHFFNIFFLNLILLVLAATPASAGAATEPIRLGSVAMDIPAQMDKRLSPLTTYLSESLGRPVILTLSPNMASAIDAIVQGTVDLAYLTPVAYVKSQKQGQTPLVVKVVTNGQGSFQLMIVVREDSPIRSVADLAGRSFAFGDQGALLQRAVVVGAGMPLEKLGSYDFLGHYDNIVRSVLHRNVDAGILVDASALKWQGKDIRILHRSAPLPPYNITASSKLDPAVLTRAREALLRLDPKHPEHLPVIRALDDSCSGFAPTDDAEYDVIRELIQPFQ